MRKDFSNNPVVRHCIEFSLMIIKYVERLEADRKFVIANQVLKSGTSIGGKCGRSAKRREQGRFYT